MQWGLNKQCVKRIIAVFEKYDEVDEAARRERCAVERTGDPVSKVVQTASTRVRELLKHVGMPLHLHARCDLGVASDVNTIFPPWPNGLLTPV